MLCEFVVPNFPIFIKFSRDEDAAASLSVAEDDVDARTGACSGSTVSEIDSAVKQKDRIIFPLFATKLS